MSLQTYICHHIVFHTETPLQALDWSPVILSSVCASRSIAYDPSLNSLHSLDHLRELLGLVYRHSTGKTICDNHNNAQPDVKIVKDMLRVSNSFLNGILNRHTQT